MEGDDNSFLNNTCDSASLSTSISCDSNLLYPPVRPCLFVCFPLLPDILCRPHQRQARLLWALTFLTPQSCLVPNGSIVVLKLPSMLVVTVPVHPQFHPLSQDVPYLRHLYLIHVLSTGLAGHLVVCQLMTTRVHMQLIPFRPLFSIPDLIRGTIFHLLSKELNRNRRLVTNVLLPLLPAPKFLRPSSYQFVLLQFRPHPASLRRHLDHLLQGRRSRLRLLFILKRVDHFPTVGIPRTTLHYPLCHHHVHHQNLF
jgi:hypothetical protein